MIAWVGVFVGTGLVATLGAADLARDRRDRGEDREQRAPGQRPSVQVAGRSAPANRDLDERNDDGKHAGEGLGARRSSRSHPRPGAVTQLRQPGQQKHGHEQQPGDET